jgi:hypothetical protein
LSSRHAAEVSALNEQLMLEADNMRATYTRKNRLSPQGESGTVQTSRRAWRAPSRMKKSLSSCRSAESSRKGRNNCSWETLNELSSELSEKEIDSDASITANP